MLDIPGAQILDKKALVGGCIRLPIQIDAARLHGEFASLPQSVWGSVGGRLGVHSAADSVFLRGHAPAQGESPITDRPLFDSMPYARQIVEQLIPAPPLRCLLAKLPPGATIPPHVDRELYFWKSIRVHVPVETHERMWMYCDGLSYVMRPGEAWALNNTALHAVWNESDTLFRTHLICDFLPAVPLLDLLARAERELGRDDPHVIGHLTAHSPQARTPG
jgi:hypothetical protein